MKGSYWAYRSLYEQFSDAVRARYVSKPYSARTTVGVDLLDMASEVDCIIDLREGRD